MGEPMRLQKAISRAGLMSRRAAEELVARGRVTVDGVVAAVGDRVDPETQKVAVDGVPIPINPALVTYLLYKPAGVISTASDPHGRATVLDLVPPTPRVYPVGRLDADSEGLLLLSNDGDLTNLVTHPRHGVHKTYLVVVAGRMKPAAARRLVDGVELEDGPARALTCQIVDHGAEVTMLEMTLGEGRNRQVRRMADAVGHPVTSLVRTAIGPLTDQRLRPGSYRRLQPEEVAGLYRAASE